ncbi:Dual specificity protein phosphatase cdc14a [Perkinsus chesapeaki]|uniref:protein-tyrosine-phosphatase n=1 Tax=Perkinsus chesapeaki TaxID=330153 RepID=A0A7J6LCL5_PERCH|nr:Dual specificity protein phosphatase cdc14a [Perkinsus chesapeaki]
MMDLSASSSRSVCSQSSLPSSSRKTSVVDLFREAMATETTTTVPRFTHTGPRPEVKVVPQHLIPYITKCTVVTLIPGRYIWASVNKSAYKVLDSGQKYIQSDDSGWDYLCTDSEYDYQILGKEFGPYDLALTHKYIVDVSSLLSKGHRVVHFCASKNSYRAASACLAALYMTYRGDVTGTQAARYFTGVRLEPFRDANLGVSTFDLTLENVCEGFEFAVREGWFNVDTFDRKSWEHYQQLANGDMNWIIPGKILAFAGPSDTLVDEQGQEVCHPELYVKIFSNPDFAVSTVVRLNEKRYSPDFFTSNGIKHYDLNFEDGSCPSTEMVKRFFAIVDSSEGAVAVHCKAGLGRTGTLIGLWAMREFGLTAPQFIGWCRLCRPGSILGPQQAFLIEMQQYCHNGQESSTDAYWAQLGSRSPIGRDGDLGQASRLLRSKRLNDTDSHLAVAASRPAPSAAGGAREDTQRKRKSARRPLDMLIARFARRGSATGVTAQKKTPLVPEYKNESWYEEVQDTLSPAGQLNKRHVGDAAQPPLSREEVYQPNSPHREIRLRHRLDMSKIDWFGKGSDDRRLERVEQHYNFHNYKFLTYTEKFGVVFICLVVVPVIGAMTFMPNFRQEFLNIFTTAPPNFPKGHASLDLSAVKFWDHRPESFTLKDMWGQQAHEE